LGYFVLTVQSTLKTVLIYCLIRNISHCGLITLYFIFAVNKARGFRNSKAAEESKRPEALVYVPLVREHENPEYRPVVSMETSKKKTDNAQPATDDFHFDKYKKKARKY